MRILHVNKRYPPHVGGIEAHVRDLAQAQSRLPDVEVEVLAVAEGPPGEERDGRVRVRRVRGVGTVASNPLSVEIVSELDRFARSGDHDVWHFHYPFPTGELSLLALRACRGRLGPVTLCTYHSDFVAQSAAKRVLSRPYAASTRAFLRAMDGVLAASPQLAALSCFLPAVGGKVRVIPYGIDTEAFARTPVAEAQAAEVRSRYEGPHTLFVGRLVPYKGVEVLLRAFVHVPGSLVIVGDGPLRESLEARSRELGLEGRVHFLGSVPGDRLRSLFLGADLFVLPSVTPNEAFGLVQLEAHACGIPVVSTSLPTGVPFANRHLETGLVVTPGDVAELAAALGLLLEDEALRIVLGRQALRRVRSEFTLARMAEQVTAYYEELLGAREASDRIGNP